MFRNYGNNSDKSNMAEWQEVKQKKKNNNISYKPYNNGEKKQYTNRDAMDFVSKREYEVKNVTGKVDNSIENIKKFDDEFSHEKDVTQISCHNDEYYGNHLKFKHEWNVFVHSSDNNSSWGPESFDNDFFVIDSVGKFMQFSNSISKFDTKAYTFFVMKSMENGEFIHPTWEHEKNRNGGTCSIRIAAQYGDEIMQQICVLMLNESLISQMQKINGVSYTVKGNWALIKLWTCDEQNISSLLPQSIFSQHSESERNIRFKINEPEY
jgi:hypothetical protein